jgi:hypothetical protein
LHRLQSLFSVWLEFCHPGLRMLIPSRARADVRSHPGASRAGAGAVLACASLLVSACLADREPAAQRALVPTRAPTHAVTLSAPKFLTGLMTGARDVQGDPVTIRCPTCHAMLAKPAVLPANAAGAAGPHLGLRFKHGELPCGSCHDNARVYALRLADGRELALVDAIELCSQCHGPQARDYRHGAHGGMRGYWDLSRGPRERNTCVGCHDPHEPAYPQFLPAPPPNDRFAQGAGHHD